MFKFLGRAFFFSHVLSILYLLGLCYRILFGLVVSESGDYVV